MSTTTELRLVALIEDLTTELYESSRARSKEHRELLKLGEETLAVAQTALERLKKEQPEPSPDEHVKVSLKPSTLVRFIPWIIAAGTALLEALHRMKG